MDARLTPSARVRSAIDWVGGSQMSIQPRSRAFIRGMHRYRTDKEFSKRVLGKYGKITNDEILEETWQDYVPTLVKVPRPSLKAIQFLIDNQFRGKTPLPKPESFIDTSNVDQLEKSGFIDSVYK